MTDHVGPTLGSERLVLRPWRDADRAPMAALNADPVNMRYFPAPLTRGQSDRFIDYMALSFAADGFALWAVDVVEDPAHPEDSGLVGAVGLLRPHFEAPFTPCVEVGWRLDRRYWGRGYATEAARAALAYGFDVVGLDSVVSFTSAVNLPSRAVMERLGMTHDPAEDFCHPHVPAGHPLEPHVLYRLGR